MSKPETISGNRHYRVSYLVTCPKKHCIATRTLRFDTTLHVYPEVYRSTAIYCILLSQCMRHNLGQPSQVAGNYSASRTRNRTRERRAQNSNVFDMTNRSQTQRTGPSTETGPKLEPQPQPHTEFQWLQCCVKRWLYFQPRYHQQQAWRHLSQIR